MYLLYWDLYDNLLYYQGIFSAYFQEWVHILMRQGHCKGGLCTSVFNIHQLWESHLGN